MPKQASYVTGCLVGMSLFSLGIGIVPPRASESPSLRTSSVQDSHNRMNGERHLERVMVLAPVLPAFAAIDEGLEQVMAISAFNRNIGSDILGHVFPNLASLPLGSAIGALPDPERIMSLRPAAVVVWQTQAGILRKIGYPGLVELKLSSSESIFDIWSLLGTITGQEARAQNLWNEAEEIQRRLQNALPSHESRTLLLMTSDGFGWWLGGRKFDLTPLSEKVGGINAAPDKSVSGPVNPEEVLRLDPDFIILPRFGEGTTPDSIYTDARAQPLKAVQHRHVYLAPVHSSFNAPVDDVLLSIWLAEILHPSLPSQSRTILRAEYERAYNYRPSDGEIDATLHLRENASSEAYGRFAKEGSE